MHYNKAIMKRIFSGAAPSGVLTIGNLIGALENWVKLQEKYENIFCVVDLHAITVRQDPKLLKERSREFVKDYLACGIDPKKSTIFIQSHIKEHAELAWILSCYAYFGEFSRMIQFKEKSEKHEKNINIGLFNYPALMAADILLYQTDLVPVGEDQLQHIEITRDLAERFNKLYGKTFTIPEGFTPKEGARIMSLLDPASKMSKSDTNIKNIITLRDKKEEIKQKIQKAVTDEKGIENLAVIHSSFSGQSTASIKQKFAGRNADFKKELAEVIIEGLKPIQEKLEGLDKNPAYIEKVLKDGAEKVRPIAEKTINDVKKKIGLG